MGSSDEKADWKEVLQICHDNGKHKAAGLDGMSADLVWLLVEDSRDAPTPFLAILTELINIALTTGETPCHGERP